MNEQQIVPNATMSVEEANKIKASINVEQLYKDNAERIVEEQLRNLSNTRAEREPLPGVTAEALDSDNLTVKTSIGIVEVRRMVAVDITIFKLSDSPFYSLIMGDIKDTDEQSSDKIFKTLFPDEELLYSVVYQFTHPAKFIYNLVKKDKDQYKDKVIEEMIDKEYSPADLTLLVETILKHVGMVNAAKVDFEETKPDDDKKKQS